MREPPRRRRLDDESRGGLPLFPLVLVVILAGLLLGGVLAHFFGRPKGAPQAPAAVAALPSLAATPAPILTTPAAATPAPTPSATSTPLLSPTPARTPPVRPAPAKTVHVRTAAIVTATQMPSATPPASTAKASPMPKAIAVAAAAASMPPAATGDQRATTVVRSYLEALARGDRTAAASYLAHGLPSETFMNSDSHIESIRSASVGPQEYRVTADVQTVNGEYYVTFTVESGPAGLEITDHYSIRPQ